MSGTLPPADGKPGGQWGKVQKRVVLEPSEVRRNVKENGKRTTKQPNTPKKMRLFPSFFYSSCLLYIPSVAFVGVQAVVSLRATHSIMVVNKFSPQGNQNEKKEKN